MHLKIDPAHKFYFEVINRAADEVGQKAYVVGGYVRDYYLNRLKDGQDPDLDFVTVGSGIKLAQKVYQLLGEGRITTYKRFGTALVSHHGYNLEFVGARRESYSPDSRKPMVEDGTMEDDQLRRDFTINAMSWSLNTENFGELIDPFNGTEDLEAKIIRTPVDPDVTFDDDPLRMMRAIRFASQLNFKIHPTTLESIKRKSDRIKIVSKERIVIELNKMMLSPKPSIGFKYLDKTGLLKILMPEIVALKGVEEKEGFKHKDNFLHTLKVVDNICEYTDNLYLRWAALFHDVAKPATKRFYPDQGWTFHGHEMLGAKWIPRIFRRLGLPLDERMHYVKKLVRLHQRPIALVSEEVTDSAIRRLIFEADEAIEDLMVLCKADITTKNEWRRKKYKNNFEIVKEKIVAVEERDRLRNWKNPISGEQIMNEFGIKPGPMVGKFKEAIKEAILNGDIPNEKQAAYDYMLAKKDEFLEN